MRESRGDDALEISPPPPAAKRHRTNGTSGGGGGGGGSGSSDGRIPDDFSHSLIYNVSLTDMLVSTQRVAASTGTGDASAEEARKTMCSSLGRPKFSNQVSQAPPPPPPPHLPSNI